MSDDRAESKTYSCKECVNRGTPLCIECKYVKTTKGIVKKPTFYISEASNVNFERTRNPAEGERLNVLRKILIEGLMRREPILTALVLEYNVCASRERSKKVIKDAKDEDISGV